MNKKERDFIETVRAYYVQHGRKKLPWRKTRDPYRILVSEIMLQQTQVDRVLPKYTQFLAQFPDVHALAQAKLADVLIAWQGLGYNRRAKMLHACAQEIVQNHKGKFPRDTEALQKLPGIGAYTAGAVMAFAFNTPVPIIETNIRTVYLHHFFKDDTDVSDADIFALVSRTLDAENPRVWYWALMDYGSYLKKTIGNPNHRGKAYVKQSPFAGSDRQIRGAVIKTLAQHSATRKTLHTLLSSFEDVRVDAQIEKLIREGMIVRQKGRLLLP